MGEGVCDKVSFLNAQASVERAAEILRNSKFKLRALVSTPPERYDPIKALSIVTKGYAARAEYERALASQRELARECGCKRVVEEITVQVPGSGPEQGWVAFCKCGDEYFDADNTDPFMKDSVCIPFVR